MVSFGDLTSQGLCPTVSATLQAGQKALGALKAQTQGICRDKADGKSDPELESMGCGSKRVRDVEMGERLPEFHCPSTLSCLRLEIPLPRLPYGHDFSVGALSLDWLSQGSYSPRH